MGIVVIPQAIAPDLLQRLQSHSEANEAYFESVKRGDFSNAWVDRILGELECPTVRGTAAGEDGLVDAVDRTA